MKRSRPLPHSSLLFPVFPEPSVGGVVEGLREPFFTSISEDKGEVVASVSCTEGKQRLLGLYDREINV